MEALEKKFPSKTHSHHSTRQQQHNKWWIVVKDGISISEPVKQKVIALQELETAAMKYPGARLSIVPIIFYRQIGCLQCKGKLIFQKLVGSLLIYKCGNGHIHKVGPEKI